MVPGDHFLLGTDLVKDRRGWRPPTTTPRASPPSSTRTCSQVLNRELGADFDLDAFEHVARYDASEERMDIRLRSLADQGVRLEGIDLTVEFAAGEEMRTEISTKFTRERLEAGLRPGRAGAGGWFTDAGRRLRAQPRATGRA